MKPIFIVLFVLVSLQMNAQIADYRIQELADERAAELATRLELDTKTERAMARIFYKYDYMLSDALAKPDEVASTLRNNRLQKQEELKKILNPYDFQAFLMFSEIEQTGLREDYHEFFTSLLSNQAFLDEYLDFELNEVFPVLSFFNNKLTEQMRVSDYNDLMDLQHYLYDMLDTIPLDEVLKHPINQRPMLVDNEHRRQVLSIMNKYSDDYAAVMTDMAPYSKRWNEKTQEMIGRYYSKGELETINKNNQFLSKVGLASVIEEFQFYMLVPHDEEKYIEMIELKNIIQQNVSFNLRSK